MSERLDAQGHQVYLARARKLSMNDDAIVSHPDMEQIQVEALVAFYLCSSDLINLYVLLGRSTHCHQVVHIVQVSPNP